MKQSLSCLVVAAAAMLVSIPTADAQPTILLSDSFERTTGNANPDNGAVLTDWGMNDNAMGGSIVQTYLTTPTRDTEPNLGAQQTVQEADDPSDNDNEGVLRFGVTAVDYNLATDPNVLAGGGFTVEFSGRRTAGGFLSFSLGTDPDLISTTSGSAAFLPVTSNNAGEHAYIFQAGDFADLRMQVFESGMKLVPPDNIDFVTGDANGEFDALITVLAPNGFDVGDSLEISVEVDDTPVAAATHTVDVLGDFPGYIAWSSNSGGALVDDLIITALGTATGMPGDYNDDGVVDAADYTVWRDNLGGPASALNGNGSGAASVVQADYDLWRSSFGAGQSPVAAVAAAAPEPYSLTLLACLAATPVALRRPRA